MKNELLWLGKKILFSGLGLKGIFKTLISPRHLSSFDLSLTLSYLSLTLSYLSLTLSYLSLTLSYLSLTLSYLSLTLSYLSLTLSYLSLTLSYQEREKVSLMGLFISREGKGVPYGTIY
ncbi:hypothetical protein ACL6C3_01250 [Capilliphycus salinus ALCB114379]|uniref:hypothetical protein n=1 Tax=Capilliphycus salinus TaxID=2768948 RepID=UPI0039A56A1F